MALLKFFEGKEGSYSSSSHSGGLYFAKDTGVILFKGVKYGSKPDLSNYATKSDISSLQSKLNEKADADHTHSKSDITDLGLASSSQDGLMSATDKSKLDNLYNITDINSGGSADADADSVDITFSLSRDNGPNFTSTSVINAATTSKAGVMSAADKKNLDNLVGDKSIVRRVYFNLTSSVGSPNTNLSHDIGVENNKVGFVFSPPMIAMYKNYVDPTGNPGYVETIHVVMLDATSERNGHMTKTQASQLSSLYSKYGSKSYLSLSDGGTVTGNVAFDGGVRINNASLELMGECIDIYHATPFIDFHYNKSSADYTSRIIETHSGVLNINEVSLSNGQVTATKVTQTSDIRLKENISTIVEDTDKIKNVKFFEFNHISDKNKTKSYGVIAQDLEEVGLNNLVIEDADGYKSVDYISLLVLEIQRLRNEVNTLKSKIR